MRKVLTFVFVLVLIGAGIYYFMPSGRPPARSLFKPTASSTKVGDNSGRVLGTQALERIGNGVQHFASTTGQVLGNAVSGFVDNLVADAVQGAKEAIVDQVADVLGVSNPDSDFGICSAHKKGELVTYLIEFPSATSAVAYSVDWGDRQVTDSSVSPGTPNVLVSHIYGEYGNYTIKFAGLIAGSMETLAQKEVCVRE
jgi:hypothetical protein